MIKISKNTNLNSILKLIDVEIGSISAYLETQKILNKQILTFFKNFASNMDIELNQNQAKDAYEHFNQATLHFKKSNSNISSLNFLINLLRNLKKNVYTLNDDFYNKVEDYNRKYSSVINQLFINTTSIENFIHSISFLDFSVYITPAKNAQPSVDQITSRKIVKIEKELKNSKFKENVLLISEKKGYVLLPYTIEDLKRIYLDSDDNYDSLREIIDTVYIRPLEYYKFSAIARFKEAYSLVLNREHGTKKQALHLACELFANYNLHPAIITACKNLNELDVYLSCLEDNVLGEFKLFKVIFEMSPSILNKTAKGILTAKKGNESII